MAPIFYYSFPLELELASVLWIDLYCWPCVKECFLDLSLEDTLAFPCPLMSDGSQNRDTVVWFLMYLLLTMGDFRRLSADRRTKRARHQIPAEALVTSMATDCTPTLGSTFLQWGLSARRWTSQRPHLSSLTSKPFRLFFHQRWASSKANEEPTTVPWLVLLLMVIVIFIEKTIMSGAADPYLWIIVTSRK